MSRILLVRHAMAEMEPAVDPAEWVLGPAGVEAARRLGALLPADAVLVASDEPKAVATLAAAAPGRAITAEPGLREVRRPREPFDDPAAFWSGLRLPDLLEVADGRIRRAGPP